MLVERGKVVGHRGKLALVEGIRSSACDRCRAAGFCALAGNSGRVIIEAADPFETPEGTEVEVGIPEKTFLTASALVYLLPALAMVAGIIVGKAFLGSDVAAALIGIGFGVLTLTITGLMAGGKGYRPRIIKRFSKTPST